MSEQFRKKPVVIDAVQWFKNGDHPDDGRETFPERNTPGMPSTFSPLYTGEYAGQLLEGKVVRYFRRPDVDGEAPCRHCGVRMHEHGWIDTLEGGHIVCPGDWVIRGVKGELYPCKPDVFAATYEPVAPPLTAPQCPRHVWTLLEGWPRERCLRCNVEKPESEDAPPLTAGPQENEDGKSGGSDAMDTNSAGRSGTRRDDSTALAHRNGSLTAGPVAPPPDPFGVVAHPCKDWHEDDGDVLWWLMPISEAPYVGSPLACDWPFEREDEARLGWTRLKIPVRLGEAPRGAARPPHPGLSLSIQQDPLAISALLDDVKRQADAATTALFNVMRALQPVLGDDVWRVDRDGLPALITEKLSETVARPPASPPALEALLAKWRTKAAWLKGQESPDAVLAMGDHAAETTYTECADELAEAALAVPPEAPPR